MKLQCVLHKTYKHVGQFSQLGIHVFYYNDTIHLYVYRGEDDVALFDFTSLFASENAARIVERKGRKVLLCVAGDSLNEVCILYHSYILALYNFVCANNVIC